MSRRTISINRAPVRTLWAAVVAGRLGFGEDEALSLGKAVAGLNAQSKGRRLGIFKPHAEKARKAREKGRGERFFIEVLGRPVPATNTDDGIRAVRGSSPVDPGGVRRYLEGTAGWCGRRRRVNRCWPRTRRGWGRRWWTCSGRLSCRCGCGPVS
jgi:hypothetical protein